MSKVIKLFRFENASGTLLIAATLLALVAANSPLAPLYELIHHLPVHVQFGPLAIEEPLVQWINEGLMVLFFLLVGLELKRELLEGHLATFGQIALPACAAAGGMLVPALIYLAITWPDATATKGWAIPTATDIVLALGILSFLGRRVPASLKVFLTALAIFDDIGAVLIIGLFYGDGIALTPLLFVFVGVVGLALLNFFNVTRVTPYLAVSLFLWVAMLESGIEAALTGVLIGFAVPLRSRSNHKLSPLRTVERQLHPWGMLGVVPLFAFFNAGVSLADTSVDLLLTPISTGVVLGLFLGKQLGVFGTTWIAVRLGLGQLPEATNWYQVYGIALLAGIGFTMSLFVASIAFADPQFAVTTKLAILIGSAVSALAGLTALYFSTAGKGTEVTRLMQSTSVISFRGQ